MNMRVKINKILPLRQAGSKAKGEPFTIANEQYVLSPYKIQEKNFTGFPLYLQLIFTPPDATLDYDYVKFNIVVESSDYKEVIERKAERFDNIKKGQHRRDFVFSFLPLKKGLYTIKLDAFYKAKYNNNPNQVSEEKKENMVTSLKFEEPFDITEVFVTEDRVNSITFPLLIQHSIQSKYPDQQLKFSTNFESQLFQSKFLNQKTQFTLKPNQTYYTVLSIKPQNLKKFLSQKPQTVGQLTIKYGERGELRKKVNFRPNDKYLFFKGSTLQKTIAKKDIVEVVIRFEKIYSANFGLGDLSIVINEQLMEGIKVVKTSKSKINLDLNKYQDVVFSIICLKSGFYHVKGLTLNKNDNRIVNYVNDITLFVQNEQKNKTAVFQNTAVIQIIGQNQQKNKNDTFQNSKITQASQDEGSLI